MPQSSLESFLAYAAAFENGYSADDWKIVEPQLTDDVVWCVAGAPAPVGGAFVGREATLGAIRQSVDGFDRRFDLREPRIVEGPTPIPGGVHFRFVVVYRREGLPPLELLGEEWDLFRDGKLEFHRERLHNVPESLEFVQQHGDGLLPAR